MNICHVNSNDEISYKKNICAPSSSSLAFGAIAIGALVVGILSVLGAYKVIAVGALSHLGVTTSWGIFISTFSLFCLWSLLSSMRCCCICVDNNSRDPLFDFEDPENPTPQEQERERVYQRVSAELDSQYDKVRYTPIAKVIGVCQRLKIIFISGRDTQGMIGLIEERKILDLSDVRQEMQNQNGYIPNNNNNALPLDNDDILIHYLRYGVEAVNEALERCGKREIITAIRNQRPDFDSFISTCHLLLGRGRPSVWAEVIRRASG